MRLSNLLLLLGLACAAPRTAPNSPKPTEHRLDEDAEATNKSERKAWEASRHRAAPGVDWKAIEHQNGLDQMARRNMLAKSASSGASRWTERGSRNQAGRIHAAAVAPGGQALYAGSSRGGLWRGDLAGTHWTPLGDNVFGGAHRIAVTPGATAADPDRLLVTSGSDIHYSLDDGQTWQVPTGLPGSVLGVRRLLTSSEGSFTLFLVVEYWKSQGGGTSPTKLFRSTNGGQSFVEAYDLGNFDGDAWCDRTGGPGLFVLGSAGVEVSHDLGVSWLHQGNLPMPGSSAELGGSEAGAPRLFAVGHNSTGVRLYRSNDAGKTWTFTSDVSDYWGTLGVSIVDKDLVAWGGVETWRSTDAGQSFQKVNGWGDYYGAPQSKLHADIQGLDVVPGALGGETWYVSTDGGLFASSDGLASVANLSLDGLRVSQYYTTLTSTFDPNHVAAGAQDQGYQWAGQPAAAGQSLLDFDQVISGDYGHAVSSDGTHKFVYSVYPGFVLIQKGETNPMVYTANFPAGSDHSWLPPLAPDYDHIWRFFFCASKLYRYEKGVGNSWAPTLFSTQDFAQQPGEFLTGFTLSPVDRNRAFAVTNVGRLWYSIDGALTWAQSATVGPGAHYFYGTAILASSLDAKTVFVGGSGYSSAPVWRSTDGGASFQPFATGLPATLVYSLAEAPDGSGALFAGSEHSAWRRDVGASAWVDITAGDAPLNTYWSAEALPATNTIRFGTYGRGIWDYAVDPACAYASFGVGLGGANGLQLTSSGSAGVGALHHFEVTGGLPAATGLLAVGFGKQSQPFAGGTLLVQLAGALFFPLSADAAGSATFAAPVPNDPGLAGLLVAVQALLFDSSQPGGLSLSNGLKANLCL